MPTGPRGLNFTRFHLASEVIPLAQQKSFCSIKRRGRAGVITEHAFIGLHTLSQYCPQSHSYSKVNCQVDETPLTAHSQTSLISALAWGCVRAQELCESGGGRPGLPVPNKPYGLFGRKARLNSVLTTEKFYMAPIRFLSCLCFYGVHFLN